MEESKHKPSNLDKARAAKRKAKIRKGYRLPIRFTPEQREMLEKNAKALGYSKTDFCRARILGFHIRDKSPAQRKLRNALIQGCNNINQISYNLNRYGVKPETIAEVEEMLKWFRNIKNQVNNE